MSEVSAPPANPVPVRVRLPGAGWVGLALVGVFVTLAAVAPSLAAHRPGALVGDPVEAPSLEHLLGTNQLGQDLAAQMLFGARSSLLVAAMAGVGTLVLGALVGVSAGWVGGRAESVMMRVVDVALAVPRLPLLIVIGVYAGRDLVTVALVMSVVFWPATARVLRSEVAALRNRTHLRAARAFGAGAVSTLRRHVIPEIGLVLVAAMVVAAGRAVLFEAGLAFLGLGDPSRPSWGSIMRDARLSRGIFYTPIWTWWLLPPVVAIVLVLLGLTLIGVALEQHVSPRLARHLGREGAGR